MAQSFSNLGGGGDWIEERFTPQNRKAFLEQFANFDEVHLERDYSIEVRFRGDFDEKVKKAVQAVAKQCIDFALDAGLDLYHAGPKALFYTLSEWRAKTGSNPGLELPAAKIERDPRPVISVILPDQVKSSEEVIKTVRLLCSKLFGSLFFNEFVPRRPPYFLLAEEPPEFETADMLELVDFCELEYPSLSAHLQSYAQKIMIRGSKGLEIARKDFFKEARSRLDDKGKAAIEEGFEILRRRAVENKEAFFDEMTDRIFAKIPQSQFILPHERKNFDFLKKTRQWTIFGALQERAQLVLNSLEELLDFKRFLDQGKPGQPLPDDMAELWRKTLKERSSLLLKKNLVRPYLFDTQGLSENQLFNRASFPLWLWRQGLMDGLKPNAPTKKIAEKLTDQYKNSIHHKLFEACFRNLELIKWLEKNPGKSYQQSPHAERLKTLSAGFEIRKPGMETLVAALRLLSGMAELTGHEEVDKKRALANFEEGWSYFVSFALIHRYYAEVDQNKGGERAPKFLKVIEEYTTERLSEEPAYQIAELLLRFYQEQDLDLSAIVPLIKEEAQTLDFFVLNQAKLFAQEKKEASQIIRGFTQSLEQWKVTRYQNRITEEERKEAAQKVRRV